MNLRIDCPSTFPPGCKIVFCGEAPGSDELFFKEGFTGQAGKILDKTLTVSGLSREKIGLTNVSKRAPNGGFDSKHFIRTFYEKKRIGRKLVRSPTAELLDYYRLLAVELVSIKPNLVVACGNEALKALCGINGIFKYQGSVLASLLVPGLKVIPLVHPSYIQRKAQWQQLYINSWLIQAKVSPEGEFPGITRIPWSEVVAPTYSQAMNFFVGCNDAIDWTLDIEVRGGSIACFAIAYNDKTFGDLAMCIPIQTTKGSYWTLNEEADIWASLQQLCKNNPTGPIGHYIFFDMAWLKEYGIDPPNMEDTMLLFHRMYPELPKKLAFLVPLYTDVPYYKDDGKTWGHKQPDEKLWPYNIKDVIVTLRIWKALNKLDKPKALAMYREHTKRIMPIAYEMQCNGLDADEAGVRFAKDVAELELKKVRETLARLSDDELVLQQKKVEITNAQVHKYLYKTLNLPKKTKLATGNATADEDAIVELMIANPKLDVLKAILAERKFTKVLSSYLNIEWS